MKEPEGGDKEADVPSAEKEPSAPKDENPVEDAKSAADGAAEPTQRPQEVAGDEGAASADVSRLAGADFV